MAAPCRSGVPATERCASLAGCHRPLESAIDSLNRATAVAAHSEQLTVESAQLALELAEIKHHTETTRQRIAFLENRLDNAEHTLEQLIEATHIVVPPAEATGANNTSTAEQAAPARADGLCLEAAG